MSHADNISPPPSTTTAPKPVNVPVLKRTNQFSSLNGPLPKELRDDHQHAGPSPGPSTTSSTGGGGGPAAARSKANSLGQAIRRTLLGGWKKRSVPFMTFSSLKGGAATTATKPGTGTRTNGVEKDSLWRSHSVDVARPSSSSRRHATTKMGAQPLSIDLDSDSESKSKSNGKDDLVFGRSGTAATAPVYGTAGTTTTEAVLSHGGSGGGSGGFGLVGSKTAMGGHSRTMSDMTGSILSSSPADDKAKKKKNRTHSKTDSVTSIARAVSLSTPTALVVSPVHECPSFDWSVPTSDDANGDDDAPKSPHSTSWLDIKVPIALQQGIQMTKVSLKRHKKFLFRLDPDLGQIIWESKKVKIIPLENIKEIRSGDEMQWCREQFHLSQEVADRLLTIIYVLNNGQYKTLHLVADTPEIFQMWDKTLRALCAIRQELMQGLGNVELRERLWEKQYWRNADEQRDQRLVFDEVVRLCRHLSINSSREDLFNWFKQADVKKRDYLDFDDFRRFVKLLKSRSDVDRLYKKLRAKYNSGQNVFNFTVFECFMRREQKSAIPREKLQVLFESYATDSPIALPLGTTVSSSSSTPPAPQLSSSDVTASSNPTPAPIPIATQRIMTSEAFASFLLSPDNAVLVDFNRGVWMDMTQPLPDYFISSSHNTYLVGHQLVGESSVEGYVRALLKGCRSVELDIYDGPTPTSEPQIFHGKTLTSKVSLRQVCHAIMKYGFVASPYPIIISAEVHCSLNGQEQIASIMKEVFGDRLVRRDGETGVINVDFGEFGDAEGERLPSPEDLKGRILFKTKNLEIGPRLAGDGSADAYTSPSASDSEAWLNAGLASDGNATSGPEKLSWRSEAAVKAQGSLLRARSSVMRRVRSVGRSSSATRKHKTAPPVSQNGAVYPVASGDTGPSSTNPVSRTNTRASSDIDAQTLTPTPTNTTPDPTTNSTSNTRTLAPPPKSQSKHSKMSPSILSLLVYTTGVKCRGLNKKETYLPSHMFSLSEGAATKILRYDWTSFVKHARTHLVRIYPRGVKRVGSSNFVPTRYWVGGAQLVALNWQTVDLGYVINAAMFERNAACGYLLKPVGLRSGVSKEEMWRRRRWAFNVTVVSAQQLPPLKKDKSGAVGVGGVNLATSSAGGNGIGLDGGGGGDDEDETTVPDPYVEVSLYIPPWPIRPPTTTVDEDDAPSTNVSGPPGMTSPQILTSRTGSVMRNGFNPVWEEKLTMGFETVADLLDLVFVRFAVRSGRASSSGPSSSPSSGPDPHMPSPPDSAPPSPLLSASPPNFASPLQILTPSADAASSSQHRNHDHPPMNNSTSGSLNSAMDEADHWPDDSLGIWWGSLGSVQQGFRHLPLRDSQLSQYLFSTLFVKIGLSSH